MEKRLKTLLPSLKERKRYLVFEIISQKGLLDFKIVSKAIKSSIYRHLGELTTAKAGIKILGNTWNRTSQRGMIKANNKHIDKVKSALSLIKEIDDNKVIFKNIGVSGTIDRANNKYMAS